MIPYIFHVCVFNFFCSISRHVGSLEHLEKKTVFLSIGLIFYVLYYLQIFYSSLANTVFPICSGENATDEPYIWLELQIKLAMYLLFPALHQ